MKIFISGINGFIGSSLKEYFLLKGYYVIGLGRSKINFNKKHYNFEYFDFDLSKGIPNIPDIDCCIHAAGISPKQTDNNEDFFKNNISATNNLLSAIINKKCKKIINLSGISIYGTPDQFIINEKSYINGPSIYGLSKLFSETILNGQNNIRSISLRLPGVQGNHANGTWVSNTIKKFLRNETVEIYNPNNYFNNSVWIDDVVKFIEKLILYDFNNNEVFVLGANDALPIIKVVNIIKESVSSSSKIKTVQKKRSFKIDFSLAKEFGFVSRSVQKIINQQINLDMEKRYVSI